MQLQILEYAVMGWFFITGLWGSLLSAYDKAAAKHNRRRIPERTLLGIGLLGGAWLIYPVMRLVHHKTQHRKFMWGLPAAILLHAVLGAVLYALYAAQILAWKIV